MNPLVKFGGLGLLIVLFLSLIRGCGDDVTDVRVQEPEVGTTTGTSPVGPTASEELRTVSTRLDQMDRKYQDLLKENEKLKQIVENPDKGEIGSSDITKRIESLTRQVETLTSAPEGDEKKESKEIERLTAQLGDLEELVVKLGENAQQAAKTGLSGGSNPLVSQSDLDYQVDREYSFDKEELIWIAPVDEPDFVSEGKLAWDTISDYWDDKAKQTAMAVEQTSDDISGIPVFTLPANTTLKSARLTSRLLGRIPNSAGEISSPYGFKVVVPAEAFIANGHELPEISHAFMGGFATGDLALRCARGYITNMTFVFEDGTISQIGDASSQDSQKVLGVLTDVASTECISGELKTNFVETATISGVLSALEAGAKGAISTQTTTTTGDNGTSTSSVTGDSTAVIAGNAASGFVSDGKSWVQERWSQTFDAILVEIGLPIQIETKTAIEIDYDPNGRRIRHLDEQQLRTLMEVR
ncbi:TIGR03752 family integrating conjugative element protein [Vibrio vulnificus]